MNVETNISPPISLSLFFSLQCNVKLMSYREASFCFTEYKGACPLVFRVYGSKREKERGRERERKKRVKEKKRERDTEESG